MTRSGEGQSGPKKGIGGETGGTEMGVGTRLGRRYVVGLFVQTSVVGRRILVGYQKTRVPVRFRGSREISLETLHVNM